MWKDLLRLFSEILFIDGDSLNFDHIAIHIFEEGSIHLSHADSAFRYATHLL